MWRQSPFFRRMCTKTNSRAARLRLAERRVREAFSALEEAERRDAAPHRLVSVASIYHQELTVYEALCRAYSDLAPPSSGGADTG